MEEIGMQVQDTERKNSFAKFLIFYIALLLVLVVRQNPDLDSGILWWGCVAFFCIAFFIVNKGGFIIDPNYAIWTLSFFLLGAISYFWAVNTSLVVNELKTLVISFVILFFIRASIKTERDIETILVIILISILVNVIWLLITNQDIFTATGGQDETIDRFGSGSLWNSNSIGMMASIAMFIALHFLSKTKKNVMRFIYLSIIALMVFVALLSGSRKAVFMVLMGIAGFLLVASKGKRLRAILIIALVLFALYYVIMEVQFFYSIVGWRIESFFASITGNGVVDNSTEYREKYIADALRVWGDYPLLGCGFACFRDVNSVVKGMYAHNNYAELLANLGLIGTIIYYSGYMFCLIKLLKIKQKNNLVWLLLITLIVFVVMDFGCVSYNLFLNQVLFMIMFSAISIYSKKDQNS